jgi:DNA-binding response OmpR family regulator
MAKVLIIDGNQDDLNSISVSLRKFIPGCVVSSAQSRAEGIRKAQTQSPDLVLLDIVLAEIDDFEFCKLLKAETVTKNTPVIVLSNPDTGPMRRAKALDAGVAGFLVKPVDEAELIAQINTAHRKKRADDIQHKKRELLKTVAQKRTRALQKRTHDITQRIKELNCLYGISAKARYNIRGDSSRGR